MRFVLRNGKELESESKQVVALRKTVSVYNMIQSQSSQH